VELGKNQFALYGLVPVLQLAAEGIGNGAYRIFLFLVVDGRPSSELSSTHKPIGPQVGRSQREQFTDTNASQ
jgi:hypothetical protein